MLAVVVAAALALVSGAPAVGTLPSRVVVPAVATSIGIAQIYAVREGKLWSCLEGKKGDGAWSLFDGTGVPPGVTRPLVAVFSDEDAHLVVVSDDGLMHHHENGAWDSLWGLPSLPFVRDTLALPFPIKELRAGKVAYSMRRDHVLFYEDTRGAQFHWGDAGTTSLFALDDDGARIRFADPWLPPDWSRQICAPERCSVSLSSLAASASMLFVIAKDGEMWTRFDDYDHNGGTPLFNYEYRAARATQPPPAGKSGADMSSSSQTRFLPGDDWHVVTAIELAGKARLSRRIAIVQNGQGNAARELRVIGDDGSGARGVYVKALADASWKFERAGDVVVSDDANDAFFVGDDEWLDPKAVVRHAPPALSYAGWLRDTAHGALGNVTASTSDFWFHSTPFHMTLTVDGVDVKLIAHAVDDWTLFKETDPADDDTSSKRLKVTLFLDEPDGAPSPINARTRARLDEIFRGALGEPFAFVAVANQHELVMAPVSYPWNSARTRWLLVMRHDPRERSLAHVRLRPSSKLAATVVDVDAARSLSACARDVSLRTRARNALALVRAARAQAESRLITSRALEAGLPAGTVAADAATIASTTRFLLPITKWLDFLELHVPAVLAGPVLAYDRFLRGSRADYDHVSRLLSTCAAAHDASAP